MPVSGAAAPVSGPVPADSDFLGPSDLDPYFSDLDGQQAMEALLDDDLPEALRLFDTIWANVSDMIVTPRARFMSAYLAERLGNNRRALRELPGLAEELPLLADLARVRAASAAFQLGQCQRAIDLASRVDPSGAFAEDAALILAKARNAGNSSGGVEETEQQLSAPTREKPLALAIYGKATGLMDKMQNQEAERAFAKAARLARPEGELGCRARYYQAVVIARQRDYARAALQFDGVAEDCGEPFVRVRALFKGGKAYYSADRYEEAIRLFDGVERNFGFHSFADDARLHAARCYFALGDSDRFTEMLVSLPELYPAGDMRGEAMWLLAKEALNRGDLAGARETLALYYQRFPRESGGYAAGRSGYWLGRVEELLGNRENAGIRYEQVIAGFPLAFYMVLSYGRLLDIDPKRARELIDDLAPPKGGDPKTRFPKSLVRNFRLLAAGIEMQRLGLFSEAARALVRLRAEPDLPPELLCLTASLLRKNRGAYWQERYPSGDDFANWRQAYPPAFEEEVTEAAAENDLNPALLWAVMREESGFDPDIESWANAIGVMQLILPTARTIGRALGLRVNRRTLRIPGVNIALGAAYLKQLEERFNGHPALMIAGYNAGEGAVLKWLSELPAGNRDIDLFIENIAYEQTRRYTKRVLASLAAYLFLYGKDREMLAPGLNLPAQGGGSLPRPPG